MKIDELYQIICDRRDHPAPGLLPSLRKLYYTLAS